MALVNGPLFSLDASGKLANSLVYSKWKGRSLVREYVIPANPRSLSQTIQRGVFTALTRWWAYQSETVRNTWLDLANAGNYSTFNAFMKKNLDEIVDDQAPAGSSDGSGAARTGVSAAPTAVAFPGKLVITHDPATTPVATDLLLISIGTDGGADTSAEDVRRVVASLAGSTFANGTSFEVNNLPPGDYYIAATYVGQNGTLGTWVPSAVDYTVT